MRALISVYNKTGLIEFAKKLSAQGWEIISTGGTFAALTKAGLKNLKKIEEITGFPEIMDGRVKTLHPVVFGGILADRSKKEHLAQAKNNQIDLIDLVVCNLYPFFETVAKPGVTEEEIIENIDIGGVSLIRAAAKNYQSVMVAVDPEDYNEVVKKLKTKNLLVLRSSKSEGGKLKTEELLGFRKELAKKAFIHAAGYDKAIADYFSDNKNLNLSFEKISDLRYGENPHQTAAWYKEPGFTGSSIVNAEILHGKELSYNNIMDADAALNLIKEFDQPAAAVIKHANPCGVAVAENITDAFVRAYQADSLSAFGGIIVLNRECAPQIAEEISKVFAEVVMAPDYDPVALKILEQKKNIRLLKLKALNKEYLSAEARSSERRRKDYRRIQGGLLVQDHDNCQLTAKDLKTVTKAKPTAKQLADLLFACLVAKHVKSNAIVLAAGGVTVGIGAGQMSRVVSADIAIGKAGDKAKGAVAASDGFFPFADSIDKLAKVGIESIIQPGGSIHDHEVIAAANGYKLSMVFTGVRTFNH
ncbi:MAG: bifunctional phosphoribosylaminoimidazolecarboxamide formyltransferase/IMP cyclohydrolase [Candidatus Komeilibacteria bacterium]|nr:bifunctional phosphoribosylaminoimidazolecarboxamide formyltransferase/IMP cyclohydrolase [Candidatus Komeilibacteria bacterium]